VRWEWGWGMGNGKGVVYNTWLGYGDIDSEFIGHSIRDCASHEDEGELSGRGGSVGLICRYLSVKC
jgi:hypothetical protein